MKLTTILLGLLLTQSSLAFIVNKYEIEVKSSDIKYVDINVKPSTNECHSRVSFKGKVSLYSDKSLGHMDWSDIEAKNYCTDPLFWKSKSAVLLRVTEIISKNSFVDRCYIGGYEYKTRKLRVEVVGDEAGVYEQDSRIPVSDTCQSMDRDSDY